MSKTEQKVKNHPLVDHTWDERGSDSDGRIWVMLKDGYEWDGCVAINGRTYTECLKVLKEVKKIN